MEAWIRRHHHHHCASAARVAHHGIIIEGGALCGIRARAQLRVFRMRGPLCDAALCRTQTRASRRSPLFVAHAATC